MRLVRFLTIGLVLFAVVGCGGDGLKRVPIKGKLTAKGKPLDGASIQFIPLADTKGEGGLGRSDSDGNFTLISSRAGAKGIVPGEYRVRISRLIAQNGTPLPSDANEADNPGSRESIPPPYNSPDSSPIKVTIPQTGGEVTVEIPVAIVGRK